MAAFLSLPLYAQDFEYKGIIYTPLTPTTATTKVGTSSAPGNSVMGDVTIPDKVSDGSTEFTVTEIGAYSFTGLDNLSCVRMPETITAIGNYAFQSTSIEWLMIPNSVKTVGMMAFARCENLKMLIIGQGVSSFGGFVFNSTSNIEDIYCLSSTPPPSPGLSNYNATLHIPIGATSKYQGASPWKNFKNIVEGIDYVIPEEKVTPASSIYLTIGETADIADIQQINGEYTWSSSDVEVAEVSNEGLVKAVDFGRAIISASNGDDIKAQMEVFVTPTLTVVYPEGIEVDHRIVYNSLPSVIISPQDGWSIHSVTLDGEDVTERVSADGLYFSASVVTDDCLMSVVTAKNANAKLKLTVDDNRTLHIEGAEEGDKMVITNYTGEKTVYDWKTQNVPFAEGGVFEATITDGVTNAVSTYRFTLQ